MKKLIIAQDIKTILEKEQSFLKRSDIKTFAADTNEEILALHRNERADLIIAKLTMPGMSGETLCTRVRDDRELCNVSLIMVCSEAEADLDRCGQCRANAFIPSPINSAILLQEAYQLLHVAPRRSCRIPISVKLHGKSRQIPFTGSTENISASGILFRSSALLFEGDTIRCSFSLLNSTNITVEGEIVRVLGKETEDDTNFYGVVFTDLGAETVSAIEAFAETLS
jgi:CheY-like chemotaxis protein